MQKRLFIISNRLPINIDSGKDTLSVNLSSGGLVSAISSFLESQDTNGTSGYKDTIWVGAPGCSQSTWHKAEARIDGHGFEYLPVFVPKKNYESYYNGMSNSVLWPLFHYFPSYAEYKDHYYEQYQQVNREFLNVVLSQLRPDDVVWIHDYHLLPLAGLIREAMPSVTIGFFLHIPFPSYELFRIMPKRWQKELLDGMMGADLIGFHTVDYAAHFLDCVQMVLGLNHEMFTVRMQDRLVKAGVFPISIDFQKFNQAFDDEEVRRERNLMRKQFDGQKIIFSADRLDYTKGVYNRLRAFAEFLQRYPEFHGKVVFIMVIVPSRDLISKYAERKKMIDEYIGSLNSRVGNFRWQPVIYQYSSLSFHELIAMYTGCDLALITPIRDGMNLVAKEFVASRKDKRGVLVLSEMTGAVKELSEALTINPTDIGEIAGQIKRGLEMSEAEQAQRITKMQDRIQQYDVRDWANDFFTQLKHVQQVSSQLEVNMLDKPSAAGLLRTYADATRRLLLLDYDGTLAPLVARPELAKPEAKLLNLLARLCSDPLNTLFIISGRDRYTLDQWLGDLNLNMVAEHGSWIKRSGREWENPSLVSNEWMEPVNLILDRYTQRCKGSFVEHKSYSLAWHYRNVDEADAASQAAELLNELHEFTSHWGIGVINGNKVIEVRNKGISKGEAVKTILNANDYDFIFACGDDTTDEDMFQQLSFIADSYTFKVGLQGSYASFNLNDTDQVFSLLESFEAAVCAG